MKTEQERKFKEAKKVAIVFMTELVILSLIALLVTIIGFEYYLLSGSKVMIYAFSLPIIFVDAIYGTFLCIQSLNKVSKLSK